MWKKFFPYLHRHLNTYFKPECIAVRLTCSGLSASCHMDLCIRNSNLSLKTACLCKSGSSPAGSALRGGQQLNLVEQNWTPSWLLRLGLRNYLDYAIICEHRKGDCSDCNYDGSHVLMCMCNIAKMAMSFGAHVENVHHMDTIIIMLKIKIHNCQPVAKRLSL